MADDNTIAAPTDDLVIDVPATELAGEEAPKTAAPKAKPSAAPEVKTLRQRLEESERERERLAAESATERTAREKAEKDAATNIDYAVKTHGRAIGSEYREALAAQREITSGIEAVQQYQAMAEQAKMAALADDNMSPQDRAKAIVTADRQLQAAAARLETLEGGRRGVEQSVAEAKATYEDTLARLQAARDTKPEPKPEPEAKQAPKVTTADDFIAAAPRQTQEWLREHREFADPNTDEHVDLHAFANKWLRRHKGDAQSLNTSEFREALNAEFFPDGQEEHVSEPEPEVVEAAPAPKPKPKSKVVSAAPVARTGAYFGSNNLQATKINLEPKLRAALEQMGLDPTQWALQAREDIKAGKLPKEYLDPGYDRGF
jgi:hypothetical protein